MARPTPYPRLLSVDEFAALPEDSEGRYELQEGTLVVSPRPRPDHQQCLGELQTRLRAQVPPGLDVLPEVDLDLGLVAPGRPGTVRAPDLVVVPTQARRRVRVEGGILRATDALLVVEIVSPGSRRLDMIVKRAEYADAGVPHYWIVDIANVEGVANVEGEMSLTAFHHPETGGYVARERRTGVVTLDEPFPVRLDLDDLL